MGGNDELCVYVCIDIVLTMQIKLKTFAGNMLHLMHLKNDSLMLGLSHGSTLQEEQLTRKTTKNMQLCSSS